MITWAVSIPVCDERYWDSLPQPVEVLFEGVS